MEMFERFTNRFKKNGVPIANSEIQDLVFPVCQFTASAESATVEELDDITLSNDGGMAVSLIANYYNYGLPFVVELSEAVGATTPTKHIIGTSNWTTVTIGSTTYSKAYKLTAIATSHDVYFVIDTADGFAFKLVETTT